VEHVFTVGNLEAKLNLLEQEQALTTGEDRRLLAERVNFVDGEIAFCRDLADRRDLAARVNGAADFPVVDGLTMRGLTYLFGEDSALWHDFQGLVAESIIPVKVPHPVRHSGLW
jgi:hypothetical protein